MQAARPAWVQAAVPEEGATTSARPTLAEVLHAALDHGPPPALDDHQWKTLHALLRCRTPALGGHLYRCEDCGKKHFAPHSCRNRHCPLCQRRAANEWLEQQTAALLPVPYFHLVFTLPHALNGVIAQNRRELYRLLFAAASATLLEFGHSRLGAQIGVTAVLHTWSQTLLDHYHLHCVVTGGGLRLDGRGWRAARAGYLFPVQALSQVFRGKFCSGLQALAAEGKLSHHGTQAALAEPGALLRLVAEVAARPWVVYSKRPFAGPKTVLAYLSRYTHRVALGPGRLRALDRAAGTVTFAYKDYADQSRPKQMTLELREFLRRFCLHLLPDRLVKIRHYGLLGNRNRERRLLEARRHLGVAPPSAVPEEVSHPEPPPSLPTRRCPHCGSERLQWLEHREPQSRADPNCTPDTS